MDPRVWAPRDVERTDVSGPDCRAPEVARLYGVGRNMTVDQAANREVAMRGAARVALLALLLVLLLSSC